jgi:hypothetical protein
VEASRRRLVIAADAERRRLARSINREVLPHLDTRPDRLDQLEQLAASVTSALEALRRISKGVFPPVLARRGVVAALRAHLDGAVATFEVDRSADGRRLDPRAEAAAYFCCVEVVRHLTAPVEVCVSSSDEALRVSVRGTRRDDAELDADLQLVDDRVAAAGGRLTVEETGSLVDVVATLPVAGWWRSVRRWASPGEPQRDYIARHATWFVPFFRFCWVFPVGRGIRLSSSAREPRLLAESAELWCRLFLFAPLLLSPQPAFWLWLSCVFPFLHLGFLCLVAGCWCVRGWYFVCQFFVCLVLCRGPEASAPVAGDILTGMDI